MSATESELPEGSQLDEGTISRRNLLKAGVGLAGAGVAAAGMLSTPYGAWAKHAPTWPDRRLPASAAEEIVSSQFLSTKQLQAWGHEANRIGLRAPGSAVHEAYIRKLAKRMRRAGLEGVRMEPVPVDLWEAKSWSVKVNGRTLPNTFYVPYSKWTGPSGLTAEMVYVDSLANLSSADIQGKIAVFDVEYSELPLGLFQGFSFQGTWWQAPGDPRGPETIYKRPWLNSIPTALKALTEAGAVATIGIWPDLPGRWARQYTPYDGEFRPIPGLWIDRDSGAKLKQLAGNGAKATVKLRATVRRVKTHNLIGFIPGKSEELTVLHTHTDGPNGLEENGQLPILATAQYLARLPKKTRDRTIMVMLSSGHFLGGIGIKSFVDTHATNLVPRITSILTLEHVGCTEWEPGAGGKIKPTGRAELGPYFAPSSKGLVDALVAAEKRYGVTSTVVRPYVAAPPGSVQPLGWPGEGTLFWRHASLLDGNFITGPYGLITADLDITGMVDYKLMRRMASSSVKTVLQLASTSASDLEAPALV